MVKNLGNKKKISKEKVLRDDFFQSHAWLKLRYKTLLKHGKRCMCCGASPAEGAVINVYHVMPRKRYPELALDENNLNVLCVDCVKGKGNGDDTNHLLS